MATSSPSVTRTIGGILLGYALFAAAAALFFAISGRDAHAPQPPGFLVVSIVAGVFFALAGGYIGQRVAQRDDGIAGIGVACLIGIGAIISLVTRAGAGALWSQLAALLLMAPAAVVGGRLGVKPRSV